MHISDKTLGLLQDLRRSRTYNSNRHARCSLTTAGGFGFSEGIATAGPCQGGRTIGGSWAIGVAGDAAPAADIVDTGRQSRTLSDYIYNLYEKLSCEYLDVKCSLCRLYHLRPSHVLLC